MLFLVALAKKPAILDKIELPPMFALDSYPDSVIMITGGNGSNNDDVYTQFLEILSKWGQKPIQIPSGKYAESGYRMLQLRANGLIIEIKHI